MMSLPVMVVFSARHGDAWLVKIRVAAPADLGDLLTAADYETYIAAEK